MNVLEEISVFGGFLVVILGILYNWVYQKAKSENAEENLNRKIDQHIADNERTHITFQAQMQRLWDWKESSEREHANTRLELQKQIGKMENSIAMHDGQYGELVRLIQSLTQSINTKMDKLEETIEKLRNQKEPHQ